MEWLLYKQADTPGVSDLMLVESFRQEILLCGNREYFQNSEWGNARFKNPAISGRGLQIYRGRKEDLLMILLMLLLSLSKGLRRVGIKIDFTF